MSEVMIVMRREFLERVRTKAFILGTILFPVFMIAMWTLPALLGTSRGERTLVIVDAAPAGVAGTVEQALAAVGQVRAEGEKAEGNSYRVERVAGTLDAHRAELNRRVLAEEIDGYVYLPPDVVRTGKVEYRAQNVANFSTLRDLTAATTQAVQTARLQGAGLDVGRVAALMRPVELETARVTAAGEEAGSAEGQFILSYIVGFLVYMLVLMYGVNVQRSVLEEKTNRIAEVIVSSMRADRLMMGKIVGVGAVALLQVAIWGVLIGFATSPASPLVKALDIPPSTLSLMQIPLSTALVVVAYFILGFFLYAAIYAAIGAAVNSEQEAQQLQWVAMLPLFIPIIMIGRIGTDPMGPEATLLGMIPFTSLMVMPMRVVSTDIPAAQVWGGLAVLLVSVLAMAWLAGKIYRVGILSTGKKPTLAELGRWLRAA